MPSNPLLRLPAQPVHQLLAELAALMDRVRDGDPIAPPAVTLQLNSGHQLSGCILRVAAESASETLVLLQSQEAPMDATYLPIGAIQAVTVHYSPENLHLTGKVKPATALVPSRLDLERQVRALSSQLSPTIVTVAWDEMVNTDAAFQSLGLLIKNLQDILLTIQADRLGSAALQPIERVEVRFGAGPIRRADRVLEIGIAVANRDLVELSKGELQQAIERLL
jgi:hypothetical protein